MGHCKRSLLGLVGLLLLPACSENYLTDGGSTITTGQESDAWTVDPLAKNVVLEMVRGRQTNDVGQRCRASDEHLDWN